MKATRLLLSLALLLLVAGTAAAQVQPLVRLSWDQCDPQVSDKNWSGPASYMLVVSGGGFTAPISGHDTKIIVGPEVPDAWRFDDLGCQAGLAAYLFSPYNPSTCPLLQGVGPLGLGGASYDPELMILTIHVANTFDAFMPEQFTRYTLCKIVFDHSGSVPGPTTPPFCGGVERGLYFNFFTDVLFTDGTNLRTPHEPRDRPVTWNGGPPTATTPATWGRVKGLYR